MMIENLDEIKSRLDPRDVLEFIGYSKSKPTTSGKEIRDYCPIHEGSDQKSLAVNCETGDWHCHSCDESGDIIGLYSKAKNASFLDAVKKLTERFQIPIQMKGDKPSFDLTPRQAFDAAAPIGEHEYLDRKCVEPCHGILFGNDSKGNYSIVVPFYNALGELQTVQYVHGRGKFFLKGYTPKGAFFPIGEWEDGDTLYLAEGLATALTIWMALDKKVPVISYGSAGNLPTVASALKGKYPKIKLVVCLDRNEAAFSQALKMDSASCEYRLPSFEGLPFPESSEPADFNDLISVCSQKLSLVCDQLGKVATIDEIRGLLNTKQKSGSDHNGEEAPKGSAFSNSENLSDDVELDILKYLLATPFDELIEKGIDPGELPPSLFNGSPVKNGKDLISVNRILVSAISSCWESDIEPTASEIALKCGKQSAFAFELLKRIQERPCVNDPQFLERINWLKQNNALISLDREMIEAKKSGGSIHEVAKRLRIVLDSVQGQSESVLSQSQLLHAYVNEIKNPANKPILTGIKSFDLLIGGFKKTEVGCLAGGAGAGKTAFALQVADSLAANGTDGAYVIYISVEIGARKLTERSLKRLTYGYNGLSACERMELAVSKYKAFADNIAIIKGYAGMTVSEIRGKVLSVKRRIDDQNLVVMIDPFQRLGTGNHTIDSNNETLKVNHLISEIKQMAEDLEIPILVLSDTVKGHKDNTSGEGVGRGSYMIDHTADYTMMLRASKDPFKALYGDLKEYQNSEDPFFETIKKKLESGYFKDRKFDNYTKYASLVTPKVRDGAKFNPLFIYRPAFHLFEEVPIWENVLPKEEAWF